MHLSLTPIGTVHSCFREKFGIPRQPGLASAARATIELHDAYAHPECVRGLEGCTHIWVLFLFSEHLDKGWSPLVRPPRLQGNKRMGVFATRSTFRPNPIGLSVVQLERVEVRNGKARLHLRGADIMDGTPVIDIKPYLPYADAVSEARYDFASEPEGIRLPVVLSPEADAVCARQRERLPHLRELIEQMLQCDPRPAYRQVATDSKTYGARLYHLNVRWRVLEDRIEVFALDPAPDPEPVSATDTPTT